MFLTGNPDSHHNQPGGGKETQIYQMTQPKLRAYSLQAHLLCGFVLHPKEEASVLKEEEQ